MKLTQHSILVALVMLACSSSTLAAPTFSQSTPSLDNRQSVRGAPTIDVHPQQGGADNQAFSSQPLDRRSMAETSTASNAVRRVHRRDTISQDRRRVAGLTSEISHLQSAAAHHIHRRGFLQRRREWQRRANRDDEDDDRWQFRRDGPSDGPVDNRNDDNGPNSAGVPIGKRQLVESTSGGARGVHFAKGPDMRSGGARDASGESSGAWHGRDVKDERWSLRRRTPSEPIHGSSGEHVFTATSPKKRQTADGGGSRPTNVNDEVLSNRHDPMQDSSNDNAALRTRDVDGAPSLDRRAPPPPQQQQQQQQHVTAPHNHHHRQAQQYSTPPQKANTGGEINAGAATMGKGTPASMQRQGAATTNGQSVSGVQLQRGNTHAPSSSSRAVDYKTTPYGHHHPSANKHWKSGQPSHWKGGGVAQAQAPAGGNGKQQAASGA